MMFSACAGGGVARRAHGRFVEDARQTGRRLSGEQDVVGQTQEVCGRGSGRTLVNLSNTKEQVCAF